MVNGAFHGRVWRGPASIPPTGKKKSTLATRITLAVVFLLLLLLIHAISGALLGIDYGRYEDMTRVAPRVSDMAGDYALKTVYAQQQDATGKVVLHLYGDGTFAMQDMPGWEDPDMPMGYKNSWDGRGHWEVVPWLTDFPGGRKKTVYQLSLSWGSLDCTDAGHRYHKNLTANGLIDILGKKAPYRLRTVYKDPEMIAADTPFTAAALTAAAILERAK